MASVDDQGNVLLGNQLLISNESTDIENTQSTGTLSSGADVMETSELDLASYGFDAILPFEPSAGQRPIDPSNGSLLKTSEVYELNSTKDFYTYSFITGNMDQTHARLAYNGTHGQVWVDADNPTMFITDDDACLIGEAFDDSIYPLITENFYTESDVNADGKIAILCFDIQDNYAIPGDAYCNGYFSPEDLYDGADSNRMEIFCMDTYPTMGNDVNNPNVSQIFVGLAHEFQHMVNFNRNEIEEKSGYMDTWLDEALSEAAGYMYQVLAESAGQDCKDVHTMRLSSYNKSDAIRNGKSLLDWNTSADNLNYALSYFFGQYLRTQVDEALGSGNGVKVFNEIITDPGNGNAAVESVIQKYIDPQLTFGEFLTNYRAAMVLKADTGSFGFNGEEAFNGISTPLYIGGTTNLAGGGAIVTAIDAPFTVPVDQGTDVSCLGIFW
ncbi:hypothetical protein AKG39_18245 [Acetobacterium bakii]|uniref:Peptidase M30 n=1 Tax=Acetobacterium bakii TaxID=52689 RepID=A0A0L6TVS2_9FIRM|nr:hypothetical protein AKG39_18245 [Acetobacterium bakii]